MAKPFLKWAGGKARLVPTIEPHLPDGRLIEPFAGSCALFLGSRFATAVLADVNADLVHLYRFLQGPQAASFIDEAESYFTPEQNTEASFMALRARFNAAQPGDRDRAAIFVYLNRHAFNGMCRYNRSGAFNVPYGQYKGPGFPRAAMEAFAERVQGSTFLHQGFQETMAMAGKGDTVYADPPYVPLSPTASFASYAKEGFAWEEQQALAQAAREAADRGAFVAISNHATPASIGLYESLGGDCSLRFNVQRSVSASAASRKEAPELLAIFRPAA